MQPAPRRAGRARQARGVGVGRGAPRVPRHLARRDADPADHDAASEPDGDGRRGVDPRQSDRWRRAVGWLRQDDAGDGDGRRLGGPAGHHGDRRSDADRAPRGSGARVGHRHLADERGGARRHPQRGGVPRHRVDHDPQRRALQPDGHGVDDGVDGRSARLHVARQRRDPSPRRSPPPPRPPHRPAHRRDGARRPQAVSGPDPRRVRERHPSARCHRRLEQRGHPPPGDRRSGRRRPRARRLRPDRVAPAAARQRDACRRVPDGGLLRSRRHPSGDGRARRAARR